MKISLLTPTARTDDGSILMRTQEALRVTGEWDHQHAWQGNLVYFTLHMLGAEGHDGPFSADDIQRRSFQDWQPGDKPTPTVSDIENGMRRLLALGVVKETTED